MTRHEQTAVLVKVDRWSWYFFIGWFALALLLNMAELPAGHTVAFLGVILVLILNFVRLIIVAEQFKAPGKEKYRILGYVLISVLAAAVALQILLRGSR